MGLPWPSVVSDKYIVLKRCSSLGLDVEPTNSDEAQLVPFLAYILYPTVVPLSQESAAPAQGLTVKLT